MTHTVNFASQDFQVTGGATSASLPTLTSLARTSAPSISPGGTVTYTVGFTGGSSPLTIVQISLTDSVGTTRTLSAIPPVSGGTLSLVVNSSWLNGNYSVASVSFGDNTSRLTIYRRDGSILASPPLAGAATTHSINFAPQDFQVTGGVTSTLLPSLTMLTRTSAAAVSLGNNVTYTVGYTLGSSPLTVLQVTLTDSAGTRRILSAVPPSSGGTLSLMVDSSWLNGSYSVETVSFSDNTSRITIFRRDGSILASPALPGAPTTHAINFASQDFQVSNGSSPIPPSISVQPQSQAANLGGSVNFSVTASGSGPLAYQWRKNDAAISGATSAVLTLPNIRISDAGGYSVMVSNTVGNVISTSATLSVGNVSGLAPVFVTQPASVTATDGGSFNVNVQVTTSNFSAVAWKVNFGGRSLNAAATASSQANNSIVAAIAFGPVTLVDAATFQIVATNDYGSTLSQARTLTVTAAAPSIGTQPAGQTIFVGSPVSFTVSAVGTAPLAYQWRKNGAPIPGATTATLAFSSAQESDSGSYAVVVSNGVGSVTSASATLMVAAIIPPAIAVQPASQSVVVENNFTIQVVATGTAPLSYQWRKDGRLIPGATGATFSLGNVQASDAGAYSVTVGNAVDSITSNEAILAVTVPNLGRLINLSVLTDIATAGDDFTLGYVVGGAGTFGAKPLVIRAAGPSLGAFGVAGALDDPKLELFAGTTKTGENDNWGGSAHLAAALSAVGAFAFTGPTSRDAATEVSIATRDNSVKVSAFGNAIGKVMAEVYDATPAASFTTTTPRLINVSLRKHLGAGLSAGFVIGGATPLRVLVRAIGPSLGLFGVPGVVADPQLALFNGSSVKIGESNDWLGTAELSAAFAAVGAFPLPATSKDAALVATLSPGQYSVQVSGVNNTTGVALVEVYEVP
ncbi:MAG: immunoglobulin domain-containing protein [Opitutaceae bacterium]|nr:immunoglobulin domain-containing protein [Opitutaceae bacterium]